MTNHPTVHLALLALALAAPARALEVSIEENRAERGSIGYVDLRRIFQRFPEAQKAKQSFSEIVRQAEDQVNLRKAEVLAVRAEISRLEAELELLKKTPITVPAPQEAPAAVESPAQAAVAAASATAVELSSSPVQPAPEGAALSTGTFSETSPKPLTLNLPGLSTAPFSIEPPADEPPLEAALLSTSTAAATAPPAVPSAAEEEARRAAAEARRQERARAEAAQLAAAAAQAREGRQRELRESIDLKLKELAAKEEDFKKHEEQVEKNLLELESRRSEILLGKIYTVIQEVARENGVGVVVDKGQILFGQHSVDLTDKVIRKLEGLQ